MLDLSLLNPPQREAVTAPDGPLLVLAGAGSGKTRVLTNRIAWLMDRGVPAYRILAITFTNKAAREMKSRVERLVGPQAEDAWISTFHSCCARILRRDIEKLGYKRSFTIYDDDDSMTVIRALLKELDISDKMYPPRSVRAAISSAKNDLLTPAEYLDESDQSIHAKTLFRLYEAYEKRLEGNNALDFDDLLIKTLVLFSEHPPVLDSYQQRFDHVLVDEYQDTNAAQYQLVRLLAGEKRNLCVVGDDDQSIYGWRGADLSNILDFEKDFPDCRTVKLEQNYRSTENILDAANQVIAHNRGRKDKSLWTDAGTGEKVTVYRAMDEREEAAYVTNRLTDIRAAGGNPGEAAVLYRTNAQSRVLEEALVRAGIPYRVYGGMKFYERKEVKDIIAYLRALLNPDDSVSLRRIINEPKRAIGETTIEAMERYAQEEGVPLMAAVMEYDRIDLNSRARAAIGMFVLLIGELTEMCFSMEPLAFFDALLEKDRLQGAVRKSQIRRKHRAAAEHRRTERRAGPVSRAESGRRAGGLSGKRVSGDGSGQPGRRRKDPHADDAALGEGPGVPDGVHHRHGGRHFPDQPLAGRRREAGGGAPALLCGNHPRDAQAVPDLRGAAHAVRADPDVRAFPLSGRDSAPACGGRKHAAPPRGAHALCHQPGLAPARFRAGGALRARGRQPARRAEHPGRHPRISAAGFRESRAREDLPGGGQGTARHVRRRRSGRNPGNGQGGQNGGRVPGTRPEDVRGRHRPDPEDLAPACRETAFRAPRPAASGAGPAVQTMPVRSRCGRGKERGMQFGYE